MRAPLRPTIPFALENERGQRVVVRGGRIGAPSSRTGVVMQLGTGELRPGLINAHDHLYLNHYPRLGSPPYANLYEWGRDIHARFADEIARCSALPREDALRFGALKNLLGGVTTVVHHDRWHPILDESFPIRVARVRVVHSLGFDTDPLAAAAGDEETRALPVSMHLAEGVDSVAADEVSAADRLGLLTPDMLAVHLVGPRAEDVALLRERGVAGVWCPSSNLHLYGATTPTTVMGGGLDVLLGTDSLLTGDGTLLDELRVAHGLGQLDAARLLDAVGSVAARRLRLPPSTLDEGSPADLVVLRRQPLEARARDVALVLVEGTPRFGDAEFADLFGRFGVPTEPIVVGGVDKLVAAPLASVAERAIALTPECGRVLT